MEGRESVPRRKNQQEEGNMCVLYVQACVARRTRRFCEIRGIPPCITQVCKGSVTGLPCINLIREEAQPLASMYGICRHHVVHKCVCMYARVCLCVCLCVRESVCERTERRLRNMKPWRSPHPICFQQYGRPRSLRGIGTAKLFFGVEKGKLGFA